MIHPEREAAVQSLECKDQFKLSGKRSERWAYSKTAGKPPHTFVLDGIITTWLLTKQPKGEAAMY